MKLKLGLIVLLVSLMACSTFAATIGAWIQDGADLSGNWSTATMWKAGTLATYGQPPNPTGNTGDEVKLTTHHSTVTISNTQNYNSKLTVAAGNGANDLDVQKLVIEGSADATFSEMRVGHGNSSAMGTWGAVSQTGGELTVDKLQLGYFGSRGPCKGTYTIEGGTLNYIAGSTGRLQVGAGIGPGGSSAATAEGVFTVVGASATISMKKLYVGSDGNNVGKGTIALQLAAGSASIITLDGAVTDACSAIFLDGGNGSGTANLVVSILSGNAPTSDTVLIQQNGNLAVVGVFDSLKGVGAATTAEENATVVLGDKVFRLTYKYNAEVMGGERGTGNDIALIPEPATLALLSIGLLAIRRKK